MCCLCCGVVCVWFFVCLCAYLCVHAFVGLWFDYWCVGVFVCLVCLVLLRIACLCVCLLVWCVLSVRLAVRQFA